MADLKTNYKDDVLDTSANERRKYQMISNSDGTVSFVDVTTYLQNGDTYGSSDVNATNAAVNEVNNSLKLKNITSQCVVNSRFKSITVFACVNIAVLNIGGQTSVTASDYETLVKLPDNYTIIGNRYQLISNSGNILDLTTQTKNTLNIRTKGSTMDNATATLVIGILIDD